MRRFTILFLALLVPCTTSRAHLSGTAAGVDMYTRITPRGDGVLVELDHHFGELATAAMSVRIDTDGNAALSQEELMRFMEAKAAAYMSKLRLYHLPPNAQEPVSLPLTLPPGDVRANCTARTIKEESGNHTLRIQWVFIAPWPAWSETDRQQPQHLRFVSLYRYTRFCSQVAMGRATPPVTVLSSNVPPDTELPKPADYVDPIQDSPAIPRVLTGEFTCALTPEAAALWEGETSPDSPPDGAVTVAPTGGHRTSAAEQRMKDRVLALFRPPLSAYTWTLAILLCGVWGAMHAFTPGHGKAIVSAYLVGTHASHRHALLLGILVTVTHTAVVMVLAVAAYILKDRFVYPTWLAPLGAVMILLIGINQIRIGLTRLLGHHHTHGHAHDDTHHHHHHGGLFGHTHHHPTPPRGQSLSTRDLALVGISGGMVPCPAAIVMLLLAWQIKAPGLGLSCLVSFSLGLAVTLTAVGLLAVSGTRLILRWAKRSDADPAQHHHCLAAITPIIGGCVLILCGFVMLTRV